MFTKRKHKPRHRAQTQTHELNEANAQIIIHHEMKDAEVTSRFFFAGAISPQQFSWAMEARILSLSGATPVASAKLVLNYIAVSWTRSESLKGDADLDMVRAHVCEVIGSVFGWSEPVTITAQSKKQLVRLCEQLDQDMATAGSS